VMLSTTDNSPDLFVQKPEYMCLTGPMYIFASFIDGIMIFELVMAFTYNEYRNIYIHELENLRGNHFYAQAIHKLNEHQVWDVNGV
jgi:hypothetical protein